MEKSRNKLINKIKLLDGKLAMQRSIIIQHKIQLDKMINSKKFTPILIAATVVVGGAIIRLIGQANIRKRLSGFIMLLFMRQVKIKLKRALFTF